MSLERIILKHSGTEPQLQFWNSEARFRAFVGGIGSGKTRAGVVEVLRQPPESVGAVVAPTYPMLNDTVIPTLYEVGEKFIDKFNKNEMTAQLVNGTKILFRSADDPDRLRGPNLGWIWIDEAAMVNEIVFDILIGRLRKAPGRGWVTTTPRGQNWLYRVFVDEKRPDYFLVRSSSRQNVFLPKDFVNTLAAKYSGQFLKQEVNGDFVNWTKLPAYANFSNLLNTVKDLRGRVYKRYAPLIVCCDFNVAIMSWPIGQLEDGMPRIIAEITNEPASISEMVRLLRNEFPDHIGEIHVFGDAAGVSRSTQTGKSDYYDLEQQLIAHFPGRVVLNIPRKNPPPRDRIRAVNTTLKNLEGVPGLLVDSDCPVLIRDLHKVEWNPAGTNVRKVNDPNNDSYKLTHASDALGYWIAREWPHGDPQPIRNLLKHNARRGHHRRRRPQYGHVPGDI